MTVERVTSADVKIRAPRGEWISQFALGGLSLALAILYATTDQSWFARYWLIFGCLMFAKAVWLRTRGVDLTGESAIVRGRHRRSVPWQEVQAVVYHRRRRVWRVQLILENGEPVTLPAPTTRQRFGSAEYERDFHRIGKWWLAHRGASWRPVRPEAPQSPVQG
jgi:hypothetical protein